MRKYIILLFLWISLGIQAQPSAGDIRGKVFCEGQALSGVVVTDGIECTVTNEQGEYVLEAKRGIRFVYVSVPAGYLAPTEQTLPVFYQKVDKNQPQTYDFELIKNPQDDTNHLFVVQADVQVTSQSDLEEYESFLQDVCHYVEPYVGKWDIFGFDCGDIVGDSPFLYPSYIEKTSALNFPIYRAIGNHDMTYGGRTFEHSYRTFEEYFGPIYYSFNKGKVHYIVLDNCFYVNRDYQYIGYIDERTLAWIENDLQYIPKGTTVFVAMHIPTSLTKELQYNAFIKDETSNAAGLYELLEGYNAHILSGHTHFNWNVCFNDSLMEHNTAAVCATWWRAGINVDGTPRGYGVYKVEGNQLEWVYKSAGYPEEYQFRVYPVGASDEYPTDIIANVWNWDEGWKVEWYENDRLMGTMTPYMGYDPEAKAVCSDKKKVLYDWISPVKTGHLFRATLQKSNAKIEVKVTDRFGRIYKQIIQK